MLARKAFRPLALVALISLWLTPFGPALSAEDGAVAVVQTLYKANALQFAKKGPDLLAGNQVTRRYFTAATTKALAGWKERSFDPIFDGQDAKITELSIRRDPARPAKAGTVFVLVTFRNFGEPVRLVYHVVEERPNVWRVADIEAASWRLSKVVR